MDKSSSLRIVMQATGMYCLVNGVFTLFTAIARYGAFQALGSEYRTTWLQTRWEIGYHVLLGGLMSALALFLLTKPGWWVRAIEGMSAKDGQDLDQG